MRLADAWSRAKSPCDAAEATSTVAWQVAALPQPLFLEPHPNRIVLLGTSMPDDIRPRASMDVPLSGRFFRTKPAPLRETPTPSWPRSARRFADAGRRDRSAQPRSPA